MSRSPTPFLPQILSGFSAARTFSARTFTAWSLPARTLPCWVGFPSACWPKCGGWPTVPLPQFHGLLRRDIVLERRLYQGDPASGGSDPECGVTRRGVRHRCLAVLVTGILRVLHYGQGQQLL